MNLNFNIKYRPQTFEEIVEQDLAALMFLLMSERDPLGILIEGPFGCCKTGMAWPIARICQCWYRKKGSLETCGKCPACLAFLAGHPESTGEVQFLDCTRLSLDDHRRAYDMGHGSSHGTRPVLIFDELQRALPQARDMALCKLEERKIRALIYTASFARGDVIDEAFRQRVLTIRVHPISTSGMVKLMERICVAEHLVVESQSVLIQLAEASNGVPRVGLNLLEMAAMRSSRITQEVVNVVLGRQEQNGLRDAAELLV